MRCLKNNNDNFKELKLSNKQLGQNFLTRGKLGVITQIDSLTLSDLNNADSLLKNQVRASEDYIICLLNKALYFEKTFNISQAKYNYELFFNLLPTIYSKTVKCWRIYISGDNFTDIPLLLEHKRPNKLHVRTSMHRSFKIKRSGNRRDKR